jgi:hypothetical protein
MPIPTSYIPFPTSPFRGFVFIFVFFGFCSHTRGAEPVTADGVPAAARTKICPSPASVPTANGGPQLIICVHRGLPGMSGASSPTPGALKIDRDTFVSYKGIAFKSRMLMQGSTSSSTRIQMSI